jgi:polysaccharide biosynthesis protein PslG
MPRLRRPVLLPVLGLAALLSAVLASNLIRPGAAQAAERKVPFGFFGTVLGSDVPEAVSDATLEEQTALMARSGVESLRVTFPWSSLEPAQGFYDFRFTDRLVRAVASHRISLLANVIGTPRWASDRPNAVRPEIHQPRDPALFAAFMRALVERYGSEGTFWTDNPGIPRTPVRQWQIWNEQPASWFWASRPWATTYTRLLRAAYPAIHRADPRAKVVAGSFVAIGRETPWHQARALYRARARRYFDVISAHVFTDASVGAKEAVRRVIEISRRVRREMRKGGDARKPIILTEMSWPAAIPGVPKSRRLGLETTARGQKKLLAAAYRRLARERRRLGITQAYWFSWASQYDDDNPLPDVSFRFSGLTRIAGGSITRKPILATYARVAARYEGCRKSADARRCR